MGEIARFSEHHVTQFRPITCTHFEMRYNNTEHIHRSLVNNQYSTTFKQQLMNDFAEYTGWANKNGATLHLHVLCLIVICSRNWVPGPGSKIHYPVPNPGNWYPVFTLITDKKCNFDLPLHLLITYVMSFDFPLYLLRSLLFLLTYIFTFDNSITDFYIEKIIGFWKTFGNWVCTYHYIVVFPYLLKSWNRVRVPG